MTLSEMQGQLTKLQESGAVLSAANKALVQQIHDAAGKMRGGSSIQALAASLLTGAETGHDEARQAKAAASQDKSLAGADLKPTATSGDDRTAGQNDAKRGGQAGPTLQSYKDELDHDGDLDDADPGDQTDRVNFGKGTSPDYPSADRAADDTAPKVNASDNAQTKSGKMKEAAEQLVAAIADRVLETAFKSQDNAGREDQTEGPSAPNAEAHVERQGRDIEANDEDVQGREPGESTFDDPALARDPAYKAAQGKLNAKNPPIHIAQAEASALNEAAKLLTEAAQILQLQERDFSAEDRKALAAKGHALPDGSYPIPDKDALHRAAVLAKSGHGDVAAAKRLIAKRAKELGAANPLDDADDHMKETSAEQTSKEEDDLEEASRSNVLDDCQIIEAVGGEGREWDVMLIQAGWSRNGNYYPADMLRNAVPLFEGAPSFTDHSTDQERRQRPERSIHDKAGWFTNAHFGAAKVNGKLVEGVIARFHCVDTDVRAKLKEAVEMGRPDFIGFSIDATGRVTRRDIGGKVGNFVEALSRVHSVDLVTDPAAGGQLMRLVASNTTQEEDTSMPAFTEDQVKEIVTKSVHEAVQETLASVRGDLTGPRVDRILEPIKLSAAGKQRVRETFLDAASRREFTDDEVVQEAQRLQAYEAAVLGQAQAIPSRFRDGSDRSVVESTVDERERFDLAIQGMFGPGSGAMDDKRISQAEYLSFAGFKDRHGNVVKPFRSMKEAFCYWTGTNPLDLNPQDMQEAFFTNYNSRKDHQRIRESLTTASWGSIYADHLYLKLMRDYNMLPYTTMWQQVVSEIEDVPDFQTRHWDRVGGYSDLPVISEQGTYNTLTSPTNEEVTYSISKKGGLDDVTFESIINDRVGAIRRIPTHMARAAARTLWKTVFNMITTQNPTMGYDSVALYNSASHKNQLNTGSGLALSLNSMDQLIQTMRNQTAYGESLEILGPRNLPRTLIVDNKLEQRAKRIVNPSDHYLIHDTADTATNIDPASFVSYGVNVLVYDVLAGVNGLDGATPKWFAVADPQQVETMVVGFLNGQQEPEMFVQDQPNVGSVFSADKITYKIRHIYGLVVLDHRSFCQGN